MIPGRALGLVLVSIWAIACRPDTVTTETRAPSVSPEDTGQTDASTRAPEPEAYSLGGDPLFAPELPPDVKATREAELRAAAEIYEADPTSHDAIVWYGRRVAYLGRYREAVRVFTDGLRIHPDSAVLLRHRGHRFITLRRFDDAIADLERSAQLMAGEPDSVEIDGLPNAAGVPTGTLYTNVWYHLGLAHYLDGDLARAVEAWDACYDAARTDDMRVAATYWLVIALQRAGDAESAKAALERVPAEPVLHENFSYARLLQLFRGEIGVAEALGSGQGEIDDATLGYGTAHWLRQQGEEDRGREQLDRVLQSSQWAAFGYIASEVDRLQMG
jgi:tetratricopeptide (TPR) repeat protein